MLQPSSGGTVNVVAASNQAADIFEIFDHEAHPIAVNPLDEPPIMWRADHRNATQQPSAD